MISTNVNKKRRLPLYTKEAVAYQAGLLQACGHPTLASTLLHKVRKYQDELEVVRAMGYNAGLVK